MGQRTCFPQQYKPSFDFILSIAVADFFTEDFGTLISEDATAGERGLALALLIPIVKPLRLLKPLDDVMSGGKTVGKGADNVKQGDKSALVCNC